MFSYAMVMKRSNNINWNKLLLKLHCLNLCSINEIAESDVFLVEEEEVDSKQKIWRAIEKVYINAFLADRMGSYDDLWEGG